MSVFTGSLSQEQAEKRFELFAPGKDNISYDIHVKLAKGDTYSGHVTIKFQLAKVGDLFLDAAITKIKSLNINGKQVEEKSEYSHLRKDRHLSLPQENLQVGENTLTVEFENNYSRTGNGLHTYTDTDGKQYLYTNSEPYHANFIIPMFDQPDLKASWNLTAAAPKDWIVIANEPRDEGKDVKHHCVTEAEAGEYNIWAFKPTKRISSYLFAFVAGPYLEIKSDKLHNGIQMSVYSRESLFKYLQEGQAEEVFEITRVCMEFYEKFFGYPYPFTKYDQVFCPEFNVGAMENPGVVTHNDFFIFREATTIQRRTVRANVITHELAHMWFGNLVTMKWWNDLWLNESFADFIAHFAMFKIQDKLTTIKMADPWLEFFRRKWWGYKEDQEDTTHPIAGAVKNTEQAETIFDGITYSKGAGTLKQLLYLIGEENFSKAMSTYFNEHQWSNTTLADFIGKLQQNYKPQNPAYPSNLGEWQKVWLEQAGMNEVLPEFDPTKNGPNEKLVIRQSPCLAQLPTLRPHKMKIAFFDEKGQIYESKDIVVSAQPTTEIEYDGSKKPRAVLLNYQDEAFVKVQLDAHSLAFLKENLKNIPDEFTRAFIWRALWDMTRDAQISSLDLLDVVSNSLFEENGDLNLNNVYTFIAGAVEFYTPSKARSLFRYKLFDLTHKLLTQTDPSNSNRLVLLREKLIEFADDDRHIEILLKWFNGEHAPLNDIKLTNQNKWSIVSKAYKYKKLPLEEKHALLEKMKKEDPSDISKTVEKHVEGYLVPKEKRAEVFKAFAKQGADSVKLSGSLMGGFNHESLLEHNKEFHKQFFDTLLQVFENNDKEYSKAYYTSLYPNGDDLETYVAQTEALVGKIDPVKDAWLQKILKTSINDTKRRLKTYETFFKAVKGF